MNLVAVDEIRSLFSSEGCC